MSQPMAEKKTLQDRIYMSLSDEITQGILRPGERLRVAHIASRFGTSQAPVREALRRLTEEGRAITEPFIGSVVKEPTLEEIEDIYAVRAELEAFATRQIVGQSPTKSLAGMKKALRELGRAVRTGDEVQVIDADLEFHRELCSLADSKLTLEVWETIMQRVRGARMFMYKTHPDSLVTVVPSHEKLIEAIESGDVDHAECEVRDHIHKALQNYIGQPGQKS